MGFDDEITDLAERLGITLPTDGLAHNAVATPRGRFGGKGSGMEDERPAGKAPVSVPYHGPKRKQGRPRLCAHPEDFRTLRIIRQPNGKTYETSYCRPCHAAKAKARRVSRESDVSPMDVQLERLETNSPGS